MKLRLIIFFIIAKLAVANGQENCVTYTVSDTVYDSKIYCLEGVRANYNVPDSVDLYLQDFIDFLNDSTQLLFEKILIHPNNVGDYYFDPNRILNLENKYEWQDSIEYYMLYDMRSLKKENILVYEIHFTSSFQAYSANRTLNKVFFKEDCPSNAGPCFFDWLVYKNCLFFFSSNPIGEGKDIFLERTVAKIRYFLLSIE